MFEIRNTTLDDLAIVLNIYSKARAFMKANNNPNQWGDNWPSEQIIREDIAKKISFVVTENNKIYAVFALIYGIDKTYLNIWDGHWLSDKEYGTVHRLASSFEKKNITKTVIDFALQKGVNLRVDTHENNLVMQKQVLKCGFRYCGKIAPIEGGERLAYELVINP